MSFPYAECQFCEVYGYCTGTDDEHRAYMEGFAFHNGIEKNECINCEINSYCTETSIECTKPQANDKKSLTTVYWDKENLKRYYNRGIINRLQGEIVNIVEGDYMALVTLRIGSEEITSMIPLEKLKQLGYKHGDKAAIAFKASGVKIMI